MKRKTSHLISKVTGLQFLMQEWGIFSSFDSTKSILTFSLTVINRGNDLCGLENSGCWPHLTVLWRWILSQIVRGWSRSDCQVQLFQKPNKYINWKEISINKALPILIFLKLSNDEVPSFTQIYRKVSDPLVCGNCNDENIDENMCVIACWGMERRQKNGFAAQFVNIGFHL